jgi:NAD(P)-dependent dehydrogenase (short-subunit alcohol dehydrogenase family)
MEGLTRVLAVELAPVRVNIVSPGVVKTPLWSAMSEDSFPSPGTTMAAAPMHMRQASAPLQAAAAGRR